MATKLFCFIPILSLFFILNFSFISVAEHPEVLPDTIEHSDSINSKIHESDFHSKDTGHKEEQGGMEPLFFVIVALVIGAATRYFFKKSFLPYTVLLLIFGLGLGLLTRFNVFENFNALDISVKWAGTIDPHLILFVFLPTLIFEAAFAMDVHTFKKSAGNAIIMAIPGILIALLLTGVFVMMLQFLGLGFNGWGWGIAFMFGAVVSATDPVAVVSLLKGLGASKKLGTLIEGESLLNDGTAIVLFMVFLLSLTGIATETSPMLDFIRVAIGGTLLGVIIGIVVITWVKRVFNDAMVEISVIIVAAYLTFYIAEDFLHISGVLGLVALGLAMAGVGKTRISPGVEHFLSEFWELAAFIANTLIFIIVGVVIAQRVDYTAIDILILLLIYVGIHIIRAVVIVLFYPIMRNLGYGLNKKEAYILWWGALRGAIGLALALVVAGVDSRFIPTEISNQFLSLVAGIVVLTLIVNATTIGWLVKRLGLTKLKPARALMIYNVAEYLRSSSENAMERIKGDRYMKTVNWKVVTEFLPEAPANHNIKDIEIDTLSEMRIRVLEKEKSCYWSQFKEGLIGSQALRYLKEAINEGVDAGGTIPLSDREDLEVMWKTPWLLNKLQNIWGFEKLASKWFMDRLSLSYDIARGLLEGQQESIKLVESMARHLSDKNKGEEEKNLELIEEEIQKNIVYAQTFIRSIRKNFPEIFDNISTRQAIRTILNYEMRTIDRLHKNGRINMKETEMMKESVEERMKKLVYSPLRIKMPKMTELLKDILWLKSLSSTNFKKVINFFQHHAYSIGANIIEEGTPAVSLIVIVRGSLQVTAKGKFIKRFGPGDSLGVVNIITNEPNEYTVSAESPVTALRIKYIKLQRLLNESEELRENIWFAVAQDVTRKLFAQSEMYKKARVRILEKALTKGKKTWLEEGDVIDTFGKIAILVQGEAYFEGHKNKIIEAPAIIENDTNMASTGLIFTLNKGHIVLG